MANFTKCQLLWLEKAMRPQCCHVSGVHDPRHYVDKKYVCNMQKGDAYDRLRELLGLDAVTPNDPVPATDCGWCEDRR